MENDDLRDLFAALAMQALVQKYNTPTAVAQAAYRIADAMLDEREKQE